MKKKTQEEFVKEVYNLVKDEYTVLGDYKNTNTKIKFRHNTCNNEYYTTPNKFLQGRRCPYCKGKRITETNSKTHDQFIKEVYDLVGDEYSVLEKYKTSDYKIKFRHNICNHEYYIKPRLFLQGNRCPKCAYLIRRTKKTKTHDQFIKEVYDLVGDEYSVLEKYTNNKIKIKMKHNKCGFEYYVTPNYFLGGTRCPKCAKKLRYDTKLFNDKVYELVGNEYSILEDYTNSKTKIKFRHNICNNEYYVAPYKFVQGNRCPYCNLHSSSSKNELLIEEYLKEKEIEYKREYTFSSCKDVYVLRFDFYLPEYDLLIEYDGEQHFIPGWYKDVDKFNKCHKHDEMKNKWCKENNKDLLRINYKQNPILVLDNYLNENYEIVE